MNDDLRQFVFGLILYPNNSASPRRTNPLVLQLILLPSPHISFTLNSRPFSLINPFLLIVCLNQLLSVRSLDQLAISLSFSLCRSFSRRSCTPVSVNKPNQSKLPGRLYIGTLNLSTHHHAKACGGDQGYSSEARSLQLGNVDLG